MSSGKKPAIWTAPCREGGLPAVTRADAETGGGAEFRSNCSSPAIRGLGFFFAVMRQPSDMLAIRHAGRAYGPAIPKAVRARRFRVFAWPASQARCRERHRRPQPCRLHRGPPRRADASGCPPRPAAWVRCREGHKRPQPCNLVFQHDHPEYDSCWVREYDVHYESSPPTCPSISPEVEHVPVMRPDVGAITANILNFIA